MGDAENQLEMEPWIASLSLAEGAPERREMLLRQSGARSKASFDSLYEGVIALLRNDVRRAERVAEEALWIASQLQDPFTTSKAARLKGHVLAVRGKYREAVSEYEASAEGFRASGSDLEAAITINASLQTLIYDGQYDRAFRLAEEARQIFLHHKDQTRLARLDISLGNIFYRQDRFREAAEHYERAYKSALEHGTPMDIAIVLRNMAVAYISLNEFERAEETYRLARDHSEKHGFSTLVLKADYNVAYLYYLRGEYLRAIQMYDQTRVLCEELGDKYHRALCDLDQSEMYLELNLTEGGAELAREAFGAFGELNMRYEAAKAAAFSAIAISQQGRHQAALEVFDQARALFREEKNKLWPALIDLYKALVLYESGRDDDAEDLALSALEYFAASPLPGKAALCELLLAALELRSSDTDEARRYCSSALSRLLHIESPATYQAYFMLGQAEEASGNMELARQAYEKAHQKLEDLRSHLGKEELKIAFLKNKLAVYEGLVAMSLATHSHRCAEHDAFQYVEQAKSRSLADLIAFRTSSLVGRNLESSPAMARFRDLRQKLNWTYHQIELEELNQGDGPSQRIHNLRQQSREYEDALVKAFSQLQTTDTDYASLQSAKTISAEALQKMLPPRTLLLQYYSVRNKFYACLVGRDHLSISAVADVTAVREKLRLLQLQLAKFRLGEDYIRPFEKKLLDATQAHLEELYQLLIAPIRKKLDADHLLIVPHSFLHYLPFHALSDGTRYLIDDFSVSYAPSASIYALCREKTSTAADGDALVLAVPDARAPFIEQEGRFVAEALGNARLFLGAEATEERLKSLGPRSRYIHIATHGYFRQDNPMFSSIRLGNSLLSLFDFYQLQFNAELVTLSGCGTGMNVVIGGDELIGLVRGLLYAGAQTLMVSLWEVHDESTAEFMRDFYRIYKQVPNKAQALRQAVIALREKHRHPYYWAAFSLVGKFV
jgi:CHAT domain-containing protein/tetratricopeptide (TPR) repeat protein